MRLIQVKDDIYKATIVLIIGLREDVVKFTKRRLGYEWLVKIEHEAESVTIQKGGEIKYLMWMEDWDWTISQQSALAHELIHTVLHIFQDGGIRVDPENSEPTAYYFGWLYKELLRRLK